MNLAGLLNQPGGEAIKSDRQIADRLATLLGRELARPGADDQQTALEAYLCRALGEFSSPQGLPVLIAAARRSDDPRRAEVRRAAIEALAVLASHVDPQTLRGEPSLQPALAAAADDPWPLLRLTAAFTLGVVGGGDAEAVLVRLLRDAHRDVRYNAATGLARWGHPACVEVLGEMLDPDQTAATQSEDSATARQSKRATIWLNALKSVETMIAGDRSGVAVQLREPVARLAAADAAGEIHDRAAAVLSAIDRSRIRSARAR
jgi:HEAT repeat protein